MVSVISLFLFYWLSLLYENIPSNQLSLEEDNLHGINALPPLMEDARFKVTFKCHFPTLYCFIMHKREENKSKLELLKAEKHALSD